MSEQSSSTSGPVAEDAIVHWVFPVVTATQSEDGVAVTFRGTGFLLAGMGGKGLTAGHVVDNVGDDEGIGGLFRNQDNTWFFGQFDRLDVHDSEDFAWFRVQDGSDRGSPLVVSDEQQYSSMAYMLWGYPTDVLYEAPNQDGLALQRPDLVYAQGYVRRRLSDIDLPGIRGSRFYELDSAAGEGFSGAPMIQRDFAGAWKVVGIYVGHRHNETEGIRVGYAARLAGDQWVAASNP